VGNAFEKELIEKISNWQKEMAHKINALEDRLCAVERVQINNHTNRIMALEEKFDKEEDITMAREKDIYERLEALESEILNFEGTSKIEILKDFVFNLNFILEDFLSIISNENIEYLDATPKYRQLSKRLRGKKRLEGKSNE